MLVCGGQDQSATSRASRQVDRRPWHCTDSRSTWRSENAIDWRGEIGLSRWDGDALSYQFPLWVDVWKIQSLTGVFIHFVGDGRRRGWGGGGGGRKGERMCVCTRAGTRAPWHCTKITTLHSTTLLTGVVRQPVSRRRWWILIQISVMGWCMEDTVANRCQLLKGTPSEAATTQSMRLHFVPDRQW